MKTVHLFDKNNNAASSLGSLEKTINIQHLLETEIKNRDSDWIDRFLDNISDCNLQLGNPEVAIANDGYPYINVNTVDPDTSFHAFVIRNELENVLRNGFGIAINTQKGRPDWVFSYGDLLNYHLNKEYYTDKSLFSAHGADFVIPHDEKVLVGQPSESILPQQTRHHLREFLSYSGLKNSKVLLMARNYEDEEKASQDLVFNITPAQFPTHDAYTQVMNTLSWFLPKHYSITGVDEMLLQSGFEQI